MIYKYSFLFGCKAKRGAAKHAAICGTQREDEKTARLVERANH